ncbi:MAG: DUF4350 domain-containing protein [Acidimicrobiales bacterium]
MTATGGPGGGGERSGRGRVLPFVLIVVALIGVALLAGQPHSDDAQAYDPTSNSPSGTKGMVLFLERLGARVDITDEIPPADAQIALALPGELPDDREAAVRRWVERGGVLVIADSTSPLSAPRRESATFGGLVDEVMEQRTCDIPALSGATTLKPAGGYRMAAPPGAGTCYTRDDAAYVVDEPIGRGHVVSIGGGRLFTNELLGDDDNAVLVGALLAPSPGGRVAVLQAPRSQADGGDGPDLTSLISTGVRLAMLQLVIAFVVYAFWRGRRLGRPIVEPQPVELAGSELVDAVGNLLSQTRSPDRAAAILRADLRRALCERLGLPPDAAPEVVADTAFTRTGADRDRVLLAVVDAPVGDEAGLLAAAQAIDAVRQEVLHGSPV